MRHRKDTFKVGRDSGHRRCLIANMLKSLILDGRVKTTITKAKELRRHADKMITLAKKNNLASQRLVQGRLMLRYNALTPKEARKDKVGSYNGDRQVLSKLSELGTRFAARPGGYTRIVRIPPRVGDAAAMCLLEYLAN